jgi:dTDP-3-amino-2,3,6-trideoxy-4-keto-D-glucose/dTDP-3-amino-3,4,6-trideoxy-alpha-D-glucose/dTDP-2,6-dideoxy-D-kanosamine transaminase
MTPTVPFNDLRRHWAPLADRLEAAAKRVLRSGRFLLGPETEAFESEFAAFCDAHGCAAVANGTDALEIALRAVGCGPGNEVVMTANAGMYATVATLAIGAAPVFAEIDPGSLLLSPGSAAALVTRKTAAVVATHLYGNVVDVAGLRSRLPAGIPIVEDAAQAHGASIDGRRVGSLGDIAAFSFYPTKNLGAVGDAGAVVSVRPELILSAKSLRQYGWKTRYVATTPGGMNSRIDELQAAVLREFLPCLPRWNERRAQVRTHYLEALGDRLDFVDGGDDRTRPATHLCVARTPARDRLKDAMAADGVGCEVHFPVPDHRQPALSRRRFRRGDLTETERACAEVLSLPCFPLLRDDEVEHVIQSVRRRT